MPAQQHDGTVPAVADPLSTWSRLAPRSTCSAHPSAPTVDWSACLPPPRRRTTVPCVRACVATAYGRNTL
eukprot:7381864-Prymnesium_polylepis.1